MNRDQSLAEYQIVRTRSSLPTAVHVPSGILLHSRVDPVAEARAVAEESADPRAQTIVLLGGGLGYLAEALAELGGDSRGIIVIEPEPVLLTLARACRGDAAYFSSPHIRHICVSSPQVAASRLSEPNDDAQLVIALYFERIAAVMSSPLSGFVQMLRAERVSRTVYDSLLNDHLRSNEPVLNALPRALHVQLPRDKSVVVAGAGPSLEECAPALRRWRRQLMVIAASGAVPPLRAAGIDPDWVIALEARETVLDDLADLPQGISVVVFASAHPQVIQRIRGPLYCGAGLDSRGGTTLIPALDFALQCSPCDVFLVGADLGHGSRTYAAGAKRDTARSNLLPGMSPKFLAMRAALENLLERRANESRVVYHVLTAAPTLRGTQHMVPAELDAAWKTSVMTREIR